MIVAAFYFSFSKQAHINDVHDSFRKSHLNKCAKVAAFFESVFVGRPLPGKQLEQKYSVAVESP